MKVTIFLLALFLNARAYAEPIDCNVVLFNRDNNSVHDLSKLRLDLDQKLALGERDLIFVALEQEFDRKKNEFLAHAQISEEELRSKIHEELKALQGGHSIVSQIHRQMSTSQNKLVEETVFKITAKAKLLEARYNHQVSLLPDGKVLIVGGSSALEKRVSSIELYDPATNRVRKIGDLHDPRASFNQVVLEDGRVMVAFGDSVKSRNPKVEVIDVVNETVTELDISTSTSAYLHHAFLTDGSVVFFGGPLASHLVKINPLKQTIKTAKSFSTLWNSLRDPEESVTQLVVGSNAGVVGSKSNSHLSIQEIGLLHPLKGFVKPLGRLAEERYSAAQLKLPDGRILLVGAWNNNGRGALDSIEIYDPAQGTSQMLSGKLSAGRYNATLVLTPKGSVLVMGGWGVGRTKWLSQIEEINLETGEVEVISRLFKDKTGFESVSLSEKQKLLIGGLESGGASADIDLIEVPSR